MVTYKDRIFANGHPITHLSTANQAQHRVMITIITGPPTHSVGRSRLVTVAVVICSTCICNITHQGAARYGGPVVLRPVRATPCYMCISVSPSAVHNAVTTAL